MILNLPSLREELVVREGPRMHDGQPSWTLHDPVRNRFFRLDWLTFEIFQRWSLGTPRLVAQAVNEQTPLRPDEGDVMTVLNFAGANQLLSFAGADNSARLAELCERSRPSWWQWLVHNYLFFRIPLVRPGRLLAWLHERLQFLFRPMFWGATAIAAVLGLTLLWRQWDVFRATFAGFTDLNGAVGYFAVLVAVKVIHEFGHGLVATHFGCRVPTMGVAFLVMTPVAYTDTNEAWNLTKRAPRLWIGAAGMLAELSMAAWATLAWGILPDGYLRSAAFFVATTTWVKSIVVNTSPIMRFDGYYLLSDGLDLPNLHSRAFLLARWQLREWLFCLGETPPEFFRKTLRRGLISLAIFIWCYRLVVFTGIAIFVYHFFFKALGIVLFGIEISWFVAFPILAEMKVWIQKRKAIVRSSRSVWIAGAVCILAVMVCVPLPQRVRLIGQLSPGKELKLSAPESARILELPFVDGAHVRAGQTLLKLDSSLLRSRLEKARAREMSLEEEIASAGSNPAARSRLPVLERSLETARATCREAETALAQLEPVAPSDGTFRLADCDARVGDWVGRQEQIGSLVGRSGATVVAYLDEHYAHLISSGASGSMYLDGVPGRSLPVRVASVEADATRLLSHPMLTSPFGGKVPARVVDGELIPDSAVYRVVLEVEQLPDEFATQVRRGRLVLNAGAESMLTRWTRTTLSVVWRELGF